MPDPMPEEREDAWKKSIKKSADAATPTTEETDDPVTPPPGAAEEAGMGRVQREYDDAESADEDVNPPSSEKT